LEGTNGTISKQPKSETDIPEAAFWPLIMAFISLIFALLLFGVLFGWFYRKEIIQCLRNTMTNLRNRRSGNAAFNSQKPSDGVPVRPPRSKKLNQPQSPDIYSQKKHITPDIISQPMHLTINGLAV